MTLAAWRVGTRAALRELRDGPPIARLAWLRVPPDVLDADVRALARGDLAEGTVTLRLDAPPTPVSVLSAPLIHFGRVVPRQGRATIAAVADVLEMHDTRLVLVEGGDDLLAARAAGADVELVVTALKVVACAGAGRAVVVCGRGKPTEEFAALEPVSPRDLGARAVPSFDTPDEARAHARLALENVEYLLSVARHAATVRARLAVALEKDEADVRDVLVDAYATLVEGGVPRDMRASLLALHGAVTREVN